MAGIARFSSQSSLFHAYFYKTAYYLGTMFDRRALITHVPAALGPWPSSGCTAGIATGSALGADPGQGGGFCCFVLLN
jgi:hypothetical protein